MECVDPQIPQVKGGIMCNLGMRRKLKGGQMIWEHVRW